MNFENGEGLTIGPAGDINWGKATVKIRLTKQTFSRNDTQKLNNLTFRNNIVKLISLA